MIHRFQKPIACLLACILLCTCAAALAQEKTWKLSKDSMAVYFSMTTFDTALPDGIADAMAKTRWADWQCVQGIRQEKRRKKTDALEAGVSLVVAQKDGQTMLLTFQCEDGKTWQCVPAAEETALLTGRDFTFDAVFAIDYPRVEMVYPCDDGGREVFRFFLPRGEQMTSVLLEHYRREYTDGSSLTIGGGKFGSAFFSVETTSAAGAVTAREDLYCLYPAFLEALNADSYPKTLEEARSYAAAHPNLMPNGYGFLTGANMRKKTSSKSDSLGIYRCGTLAKILGTEPGKTNPWYKVQVGETIGYISEPYLHKADDTLLQTIISSAPLTVGRADKDCELKTTASLKGKTVTTLKAGTKMYVLAECGNWLQVCVPRSGDLGYWMDTDGTIGYLPAKEVTQADTPLILKYTED